MKRIIVGLMLSVLLVFRANADFQTDNTAELEKQIAEGLDVNIRDENGDTLLYWFLVNGNSIKPLQVLVRAGADVNAPSASNGMTPLVYATTMTERLRAQANQRYTISRFQSPNERQIFKANLRKSLQESHDYVVNIVKFLIESGANVNQETPFGTPLMSASTSDWNTEVINLLLKAGANINQTDRNGRTALFYAEANGCKKITIQLLAANADINIKDNDGKTYMEVTKEELQK